MRKVKAVYTPYLNDRENKDRIGIIDSSKGLSSSTVLLVTTSAIVFNSINIHNKLFGAAKEPTVDLIDDIAEIATALMFDLNEIIHIDLELAKSMIKSILNRLFPILEVSTTSQLVLLLSNNASVSDVMIEDMNKNSYISNILFNHTTNLFNIIDKFNIEYDGNEEIFLNKKL